MDRTKTVFFTGHRPKNMAGYNHVAYKDLVTWLEDYIISELAGFEAFVTGGAQGADQLAFWAVEKVKRAGRDVKNILCLPFPGQESLWKDEGAFSRKEYALCLQYADEILYTVPKKPAGKGEIIKALLDRNTQMVNMSGLCIGMLKDGEDWGPGVKSGTADALRKAGAADLGIRILRYTVRNGSAIPMCMENIW